MNKRWLIKQENFQVVADPQIEVMTDFIHKAATALADKCARAETLMILECVPVNVLEQLIKDCEQELDMRKRGVRG